MKTVLTLSVVVILVLAAAVPSVQAQSHAVSEAEDRSMLWQLASKQVVRSLGSEYSHVRGQTLKNVIVFSTLYRDKVDLGAAVDAIAAIAGSDDNGEHRRLATAALQAMGSFRAKQKLAELKGIADDEYRLLVASVILEYSEKPNAL